MSCVTTSPIPPANLKRRNSPSNDLLDCRSLQSSLKRVRLNCSPGELRLQRDLKSLPQHIWNQISEGHFVFTFDSTISLSLVDPLRLILQVSEAGRIFIQIPRMYPHRPPVVSRIEGFWMERIVVHEAAPYSANHYEDESFVTDLPDPNNPICGTTVVFDRWSPVMHIGDLLEFIVKTIKCRPAPTTMTAMHPSFTIPLSSSSLNPQTSNHVFIEEHKMEDNGSHKLTTLQHLNPDKYTSCFPANRFDAGYGKFMDTNQQYRHIQQQQNNPTMDFS